MKKLLMIISVILFITSCGTKKVLTTENTTVPTTNENLSLEQRKMAFVQKVVDNAVYVKDISSKIDFTIQTGSKDITVGGKIQMKKDDVIRIQLQAPLFGMEVGRLEFTKDYVMIVDRIHTQYVKGDYNQVDFLKNNGLTFYSLQALFWNELFMPGVSKIKVDNLSSYGVTMNESSANCPIVLNRDKMTYQWNAERNTGLIKSVEVSYNGKQSGNTRLNCLYDDFKVLGVKKFPYDMTLQMNTTATKKARNITVNIKMKNINTDDDWETRTTLSKKYKEVSVDDIMKQLMSL